MSSIKTVNPNADVLRKQAALVMNITAAKGLQDVLRSNLGPRGTLKMLVSGAGDIKLTKDGNTLLQEMQIQNPTASLIARTATAQDEICGDGTTSNVLLIGEIMKQCEQYLSDGVHPRMLVDGLEFAKDKAVEFLDSVKISYPVPDRAILIDVARSSLRTKVGDEMTNSLAEAVVDGVLTIKREGQPIDLHMVEIMDMHHKFDRDTRLVKGIVMDHGSRHPDMPANVTNAFILTLNVSLEYEKTEVNASFFYQDAEQRERMVLAERKFTDDKVRRIIELKKKVCEGNNRTFVVINQKGIDPPSLDMLAKEGIVALRRAKKRNMERLTLACGGMAVNSVDDETFNADVLGFAESVTEVTIGEEKYTFIEGVKNPFSCTILIKGPNKHTIAQLKDATRDGLRAVKNTIEDGSVIPGGGAYEVGAYSHIHAKLSELPGKAKLGAKALAEALLIIPKTLADNSGFDAQDTLMKLLDEYAAGNIVGVDVHTGGPMDPVAQGVYDNYRVKRAVVHGSAVISSQLLLVDEVLRAGRQTIKAPGPGGMEE
eukprot:comp14726_c0_seq1/m.21489 comp14726_c0_seq1/g.21489  ORF comp14726_c0_seq1/g.21489 comp14726_c0_seq1/m.21489 type:complete len:542 (-) comp14726_c0_seq1:164-1789(-)